MKPSEALDLKRDEIREVISKNNGTNARVFGSVLRGEDTESSDLDILIDTNERASLMDLARIQIQLEKLLGVRVDVLTPMELPIGFRQKVISEAKKI